MQRFTINENSGFFVTSDKTPTNIVASHTCTVTKNAAKAVCPHYDTVPHGFSTELRACTAIIYSANN
jgi:hypothetical protein